MDWKSECFGTNAMNDFGVLAVNKLGVEREDEDRRSFCRTKTWRLAHCLHVVQVTPYQD